MGHALIMLIVIETRTYDARFYAAVADDIKTDSKTFKKDIENIFS